MAIETNLIRGQFMLGEDFTLRVVCDEALTGKTIQFVIRKEPEDATAVYSVTSGITLATVTIADDAADIPIASSGTNVMEEGVYSWAIRRTDSGQKRSLAWGTLVATRAASAA